jgi:hypothetical protein
MIIDVLFFSPPWTITILPAIGLSGGVAVSYWFWVEACYQNNGFYPYPIFDHAGHNGRVGLFIGSAVVTTVGMVGLKRVYALINGKEVPGHLKAQ